MDLMATGGSAVPARDVRTRRVSFDFAARSMERHISDDLLSSHLLALGSAVFPEGEDFFVRTVRHYRDDIEDDNLRRQVAGFIGQEAMHARSHQALNERLARLGYPTRFIDRFVHVFLGLWERILPPQVALAITAALEHYTATWAEAFLSDDGAQQGFADNEIRRLFLWHALEETEHKAVAFDVFQQVSGSDRVRRWVMHVTTWHFMTGIVLGLLISLARDPSGWSPRRLAASLRSVRTSPLAAPKVVDRLRDYYRPDFHPDDHDTTALVAEWRARLTDASGSVLPAGA